MLLLFVLQVDNEAATLARWEHSVDDEHLFFRRTCFLYGILQILERPHWLTVDTKDDESFLHSGIVHLSAVHLDNLQSVIDFKLLLLCLRHWSEISAKNIAVCILYNLRVALLVLQRERYVMLFLVTQIGQLILSPGRF